MGVSNPRDRRDASARARAGLSSREIDAIRGFFIVLVVTGHNVLVTASVPDLFRTAYSFHVYAFLLLPSVFPGERLSMRQAGDCVARYLVPHNAAIIERTPALRRWITPRDLGRLPADG